MIENLHRDIFSEQLNTKFRIHLADDKSLELELVEAKDSGSNPRQERFSILFRGPANIYIQQGTYRIEHDKIGAFDLMIVPIAADKEGISYEAIFNRLLQ
jgi:hypothetical protein